MIENMNNMSHQFRLFELLGLLIDEKVFPLRIFFYGFLFVFLLYFSISNVF